MSDPVFRIYSGAGNTFAITSAIPAADFTPAEEPTMAAEACTATESHQRLDGMIVLAQAAGAESHSSTADFEMRFYNPDGSFGALCGNGARCAVQAAIDFGIIDGPETRFSILGATNHAIQLADERVKVFFQDPVFIKTGFKLRIGKKDFVATNYVDLGSQHTVTFFDDLRPFSGGTLEAFDIMRFGALLRWQPDLQPQGANANFVQIEQDGAGSYIRIRTFERGVEGETLACGTGCMSAAIVAVLTGRISETPVRLRTQSGEFVIVDFNHANGHISDLSLEGSAKRA